MGTTSTRPARVDGRRGQQDRHIPGQMPTRAGMCRIAGRQARASIKQANRTKQWSGAGRIRGCMLRPRLRPCQAGEAGSDPPSGNQRASSFSALSTLSDLQPSRQCRACQHPSREQCWQRTGGCHAPASTRRAEWGRSTCISLPTAPYCRSRRPALQPVPFQRQGLQPCAAGWAPQAPLLTRG